MANELALCNDVNMSGITDGQVLAWSAATKKFTPINVGNITLGGNISAGNLTLTGTMAAASETLTGNSTIGGTLAVTGDATMGNMSVGGTLGVTGLATFVLMARLPESNIAGAGTVVGNATQVVAGLVTVSGADNTVGVKLPAAPATGTWCIIKNNGNAILKVWPDASATINAIAANAHMPQAANTSALYFADSATQWWSVPLLPS